MAPGPETVDRLVFAGAWVGLCVSLATGLVGVTMAVTDAMHLVGQDVGMILVILLFLGLVVSALLHLVLALVSIIRGMQAGPRPMAWVYVYLAITAVVYGTAAVMTLEL